VETERRAIVVSLAMMAAIPWAAFYRGHPFRIRYMVPLIAIEAIGAGIAAGILPNRRLRAVCAVALLAVAGYELRRSIGRRRWSSKRNGIVRTGPSARASRRASARSSRGRRSWRAWIAGHYMQEASGSGLAIRDFLHER